MGFDKCGKGGVKEAGGEAGGRLHYFCLLRDYIIFVCCLFTLQNKVLYKNLFRRPHSSKPSPTS